MILLISNNNPYLSSAGVQKYIQIQDKAFLENDIDSITIFPQKKDIGPISVDLWGCVYRHKTQRSYYTFSDRHLRQYLETIEKNIQTVFIHHLMNIRVEFLSPIVSKIQCPFVFYLHDFYSACPSTNLLMNGKEYCGSAIVSIDKCHNCSWFSSAESKKIKIEDLFQAVSDRLQIISPSEIAAQIWLEAFPQFRNRVRVVLHELPVGEYRGNKNIIKNNEVINVAFIGAGDYIKGINAWLEAVDSKPAGISFYHIGRAYYERNNVKNVQVSVNSQNPDAMIRTLKENEIHVAVLNSIWPETYSYTFFEAVAANCFIITNTLSGNIAAKVEEARNGLVMHRAEDLVEILENGELLREKVNEFRASKNCGPISMKPNMKSILPVDNSCFAHNDTEVQFKYLKTLKEMLVDTVYKHRYPPERMNY